MRSLIRTALGFGLLVGAVSHIETPSFAADFKSGPRPVRRDPRFASAQLEESRGHLDEAKRIYTAILQSEPSNAECCHKLGSIYAKLNRHAEAEVYYRQATALNPDNAQLLADRGYSALKRKDYFRAEEWLEKSVKLDAGKDLAANSKTTLRNLAIARGWMNKDELCLETFRRITDEGDALRSLAAIQIARGDTSLGQRNIELAKGIGQPMAPIPDLLPPAPETFAVESIPTAPPAVSIPTVNAAKEGVAVVSGGIPMLMQEPSPLSGEIGPKAPPAPPAVSETARRSSPSATAKVVRASPAPLMPVIEAKVDLLTTCGRPIASLASYPCSVTNSAVDLSHYYEKGIAEDPVASEPQQLDLPENLQFERPIKASPATVSFTDQVAGLEPARELAAVPELPAQTDSAPVSSGSPEGKPSQQPVASVTDLRLEEVCLVTLREKRQVTKGQSNFCFEFHGQKYHCASEEAMKKFQEDPSHYAPAAGGLDVVQFKNERDFSQGTLKFSSWYENRLFLFVSQKNCDDFKREPLKYAPAQ